MKLFFLGSALCMGVLAQEETCADDPAKPKSANALLQSRMSAKTHQDDSVHTGPSVATWPYAKMKDGPCLGEDGHYMNAYKVEMVNDENTCAGMCSVDDNCAGYEWYGMGECHLHAGSIAEGPMMPGGPVHFCKMKGFAWTKLKNKRCGNPSHIGKKEPVGSIEECKKRCASYTGTKTCMAVKTDGQFCALKANCDGTPDDGSCNGMCPYRVTPI